MPSRRAGAESLAAAARRLGASRAKIISARAVVVDERVRLKCTVPLCDNYGRHLMCPPHSMSVSEFRETLAQYRRALLVQIDGTTDSMDKSPNSLDSRSCDEITAVTCVRKDQRRLQDLVGTLEGVAFKRGFYLAAGLIGSECTLCSKCVTRASGKACKHPFRARPSMQSMGIDVIRTCARANMPVYLSSARRIRWTGLLLLD